MTTRKWPGWRFETRELQGQAANAFGRKCADMALDGIDFWIPAIWGSMQEGAGKMPKNALTVFASNTDMVAPPVLRIDITKMLREDIALCRKDSSFDEGLLRIADEMDELSKSIRRAVEIGRGRFAKRQRPTLPSNVANNRQPR